MTACADQAGGGAATPLVLLRHGPTDWTADGRLQGHSDRPLSAEGRVRVRRWRVPAEAGRCRWVTSPLRRARIVEICRDSGVCDIKCRIGFLRICRHLDNAGTSNRGGTDHLAQAAEHFFVHHIG